MAGTPEDAKAAVEQIQAPDQGTDAGPALEEMRQQTIRAALSDFEQRLADQMQQAQGMYETQQATIDALTRQLASVRLQAGPPVAALLAESLATRVQSIAIANPDLGRLHFAGVVSQAESLADEVKAVQAGGGDVNRAEILAHAVAGWFTRSHPRVSGKVLEGGNAAVDEAERILDELPGMIPPSSPGLIARVTGRG